MFGGLLVAMLIGVGAQLRRPRFDSRETRAVLDDPILTHEVRTPVTGRSEAAFYQVSGRSAASVLGVDCPRRNSRAREAMVFGFMFMRERVLTIPTY
jgi:hypothetical protein